MAKNFTAEQYEDAFVPHRLLNWQIPQKYPPRVPSTRSGFTQSAGDNKGYVLPGVKRGNNSPWGNFVGSWDIPCHLPGPRQHISTARSNEAARKLMSQKEESIFVLSGRHKSLKGNHPKARVELPECYSHRNDKRLLKAMESQGVLDIQVDNGLKAQEHANKMTPTQHQIPEMENYQHDIPHASQQPHEIDSISPPVPDVEN